MLIWGEVKISPFDFMVTYLKDTPLEKINKKHINQCTFCMNWIGSNKNGVNLTCDECMKQGKGVTKHIIKLHKDFGQFKD